MRERRKRSARQRAVWRRVQAMRAKGWSLEPSYSDAVLYDGAGRRVGVMDRVTRERRYG